MLDTGVINRRPGASSRCARAEGTQMSFSSGGGAVPIKKESYLKLQGQGRRGKQHRHIHGRLALGAPRWQREDGEGQHC